VSEAWYSPHRDRGPGLLRFRAHIRIAVILGELEEADVVMIISKMRPGTRPGDSASSYAPIGSVTLGCT